MNSVVSVETELAETTEYKRFEILKSQSWILLLHPEKQLAMSKNVIHNFNLSIKNSTDIKSSEDLTKAIIKELAKVSKEMNQQKDIVQEWQEQKNQNATAILNNSSASTEGGANDTNVETIKKTTMSISNTPLVSGETKSIPSTLFGGGVADTTGRTTISSATSDNTTPPTAGAENSSLNFSNGITTQAYANVAAQQTLTVPESLQTNGNELSVEVIKAEVKKKLDAAISANETSAIEYWRNISKAFNEGATAQDFDGKPNDMLFTQLYAMLKQSNQAIENQIFNWDIVREKMIESIDNNILKGKISIDSKVRWKLIQKQLKDDTINVANLFERYNELFLLLKEVEGLHSLPNTLTITTKTKIYPNLSADRVYADIGKENVYVFLKEINNKEITGSAVNKGAVKIKNTGATKFIVGESLDFILDEVLVNDIKFEKKDINWIVYNSQKKNDKGIIFINEGISFSYNFDAPGKYKVEAYGGNPGSNSKNKKNVKLAAFVEVEIIAQEITIVPPATIKTTFIRPSTEEQLFKVGLKNPEVKTLNPLKLYYQIAYTNADKVTTISDEQEMDSTGIVKLAMPNLGEYSIKVVSKDQYTLNQKYSINTIKNFINNIEIIKNKAEKDIYLWSKSNQDVHFKAQSFKMEPATPQEKQNIKWLVYDKNGQIYVPDGLPLKLENNEAGKQYLVKGESFTFPIPKKEGEFTIESYSNVKEGFKSKSSKKIFVKHPQVTEAYWTYNDGNKKKTSGFAGEINHIKASIPGYVNQPVRIKFYLNDSKDVNYYNDTKTNDNGEIDKVLKFDANLQKHFGIKNGKTAKIRFELEGIQNGNVPYLFKENTNAYKETLLNVTTSAKITDAYFMYDGNRVNPFTQVPYGAKVTGIVKTLNMVGKVVNLKIYKDIHRPKHTAKAIVDNEGIAVINFTLNKNWKEINALSGLMDTFYIGIKGVESKISLQNGMNAVSVSGIKPAEKNNSKIDNTGLGMIWGGKVSIKFRQKVVTICKDLWGEDRKYEMANALMIAMSVETAETFSSSLIKLTKNGYVAISKEEHRDNPDLVKGNAIGLAQFTFKAIRSLILNERGIPENEKTITTITLKEINDYKQKLALLSPEDQLDYVKAYFMLFNNYKKVTRPEDVYMIIFAPSATGKGDNVNIYKKFLIEEDKNKGKVNPNYRDNAAMDIKNDGFNKGNNDSIIQSGELLARYREMENKGLRYAIDINEGRKLNQVLAEKIIKGGRVTFGDSHVSNKMDKAMAQDNITDTSLGKNAKRSNYKRAPGGEIEILSELLYIMYQLSKDYRFKVSEISGADHSRNSRHYFGKAFDVSEINGLDIGQGIGDEAVANPKVSDKLIEEFRLKALSYGALLVWNKLNDKVKKEHHNHFHVEVK